MSDWKKPRKCEHCGEDFIPARKAQRFCGKPKKCSTEFHSKKRADVRTLATDYVRKVFEEANIPCPEDTDELWDGLVRRAASVLPDAKVEGVSSPYVNVGPDVSESLSEFPEEPEDDYPMVVDEDGDSVEVPTVEYEGPEITVVE